MSALAQLRLSVPPGSSYTAVGRLSSTGKVGKVSVRFNIPHTFNNQQVPVAADNGLVNVYESDDLSSWSLINSSPIAVANGGEAVAVLDIHKKYVEIRAKSSGGNGTQMRADINYDGRLYHGNLEFMPIGKSGYGADGGSGHAEGTGSISSWPA